jgi:hypothetical protein
MQTNTATTDSRTDKHKQIMAEHYTDHIAEYEDSDNYTIVYEDDGCVVVADHRGHEINQWAEGFDVDRETLRSTFREVAEQKMGEQNAHEAFSYSDPVVFDKLA